MTTTDPMTREQIRARLNEIAPCPDTGDATAKSLAVYLAMRAQVISRQQLGIVAPWDRAQIDLLTNLFAAAHALYALDSRDPALGAAVAREIRDAWDDGAGVGEWLWEHLGGTACEEIGQLADKLAILDNGGEPGPVTETTPPDPLVLPQDEFEMVKRLWQMLSTPSADGQLAALDRAVERMRAAEGKLAEVRETAETFLAHYGHSELLSFKVALDLAHGIQQVLDREPLERSEEKIP